MHRTRHDAKELEVKRKLGARLRRIRRWRKLTQGELAKRSKLSRTQVTNLEVGRSGIYLWTLLRLAAGLQIDPHVLLYSDKEWRDWLRINASLPDWA